MCRAYKACSACTGGVSSRSMRDDATALLQLFDRDQRIAARFFGFRREETDLVVRHVPTAGSHGYVVHSRLTPATADHAVRGEIAYFASLGTPFEWKLYGHDEPSDLE